MQRGSGRKTGLQRNTRPRLVFNNSSNDDSSRWSVFPNPGCECGRPCGHMVRSRIQFRPEGVQPNQSDGKGAGPGTGTGTQSPDHAPATQNTARETTTTPTQTPPFDSPRIQTNANMEGNTGTDLPSNIGPFVLRSMSSGSVVEPECCECLLSTYCFASWPSSSAYSSLGHNSPDC